MCFMSKDAAARWAEQRASAVPFPFPTWAQFDAEFQLRFVEENEQDQALTKLESHSYFQGSRNIYRYMDDFKQLAIMAGYTDALIRVTKHCSGLNPQINVHSEIDETHVQFSRIACSFRFKSLISHSRINAQLTAAFN
jgi:hypothetical protein